MLAPVETAETETCTAAEAAAETETVEETGETGETAAHTAAEAAAVQAPEPAARTGEGADPAAHTGETAETERMMLPDNIRKTEPQERLMRLFPVHLACLGFFAGQRLAQALPGGPTVALEVMEAAVAVDMVALAAIMAAEAAAILATEEQAAQVEAAAGGCFARQWMQRAVMLWVAQVTALIITVAAAVATQTASAVLLL